jgi:hypothetical protein
VVGHQRQQGNYGRDHGGRRGLSPGFAGLSRSTTWDQDNIREQSTRLATAQEEDEGIRQANLSKGRLVPDMHANYAAYLCAKLAALAELVIRASPENAPDTDHQRRETSAGEHGQLFPGIFFAHSAGVSGNQLYHTACIMMFEI